MGRTVGAFGRRTAVAAMAATALLAVLAACEAAPEKPDWGRPVPADTGPRDPGPETSGQDASREDVEVPAPDCEADPGAPGCACAAPEDCDSRLCNRRTGTCAATCRRDADCPASETCARVPGVADPVCADRFPTACVACEVDGDCLAGFVPGAVACAEPAPGQGAFCLPACATGDTCPAGMACRVPRDGGEARCVPEPGPCPCTPEAAAAGRLDLPGCTTYYRDDDRDGAGLAGDSRCLCGPFAPHEAEGPDDCNDGATDIHPGVPEQCNGFDDDCNGSTDEDLGLAQSPCSRLGACAADGVVASCKGGKWQCDYSAIPGYEDHPESACDGKDNDCDGPTDEDLDDRSPSCLSRGVCAIAGAVKSRCVAAEWQCTYTGVPSYEAGVEASCDNLDNDCDGATDEDFPWTGPEGGDPVFLGADCGKGRCLGGQVECAADGASATCSTAGLALAESCNSVDDDCDGLVDEDFTAGGVPVYQDPADPTKGRNACQGLGVCAPFSASVECLSDGTMAVCSTGPGGSDDRSGVEACNDLDDDCDGETDDGLTDPTASGCSLEGVCGASPQSITARCQAGEWVCDYSGVPGWEADETRCDGADSNCDGRPDDGFGWTHPRTGELVTVGQPCGLGACAGGEVRCTDDHLAAWCTGDALATGEACNGLDDSCDGRTDEGFTYLGTPVWLNPADVSAGASPCTGRGACATVAGLVECRPDGQAAACSTNPDGTTYVSIDEVCNGVDDDCDGATDEGLGLGDSDCRVTGVCAPGLVTAACLGGEWSCDYSAIGVYQAEVERSCDALDNDCDGATDEDFVLTDWDGSARAKGGACGTGVCANGTARCKADQSGLECSTASMFVPESCNTIDDDCDGSTDELGATLCDDARNCTLDTCSGGICGHAVADGWCLIDGACRADGAFNPVASCQHCDVAVSTSTWTPTADGGACDADGSGCTVGDSCLGGSCSPGAAPSCAHLDGPCTAGACASTSPLAYECQARPANESGACDDGQACTRADRCVSGNCTGTAYSCDDALECTTDACDGSGGCTNDLQDGSCVIEGQCWADAAVNPANSCQVCLVASAPRAWTTKPNNNPCTDGNACTDNDRCQSGTCVPGPAKLCDDGNDCTADSCNTGAPDPTQACQFAPLTGTSCDDGMTCSWRDTCLEGTCFGEPYQCTAPVFCVSSTCDGAGGCLDVVNPGYCWVGGSCVVTGVSKPGQPCLYCNPGLDPRAWSTYAGGTPCDDGDGCTAGDRCSGSSCIPTGTTDCSDGNPCTTDACVPGPTGCTYTNNSLVCTDDDACTVGDQCSGGDCISGAPRNCTALNPDCDPTIGSCACGTGATAKVCGSTTADRCTSGTCQCGANPACVLSSVNPDCSKDATPKCACCAPGSSAGCGVCNPLRADQCLDGTCSCGGGSACATGWFCCEGTCREGLCP